MFFLDPIRYPLVRPLPNTEAPYPARDNPGFVSDTISERWAASCNGRHHLGAVRLCDPGGWRGVGAGGNLGQSLAAPERMGTILLLQQWRTGLARL
jgi:hypothetical protein